MAFLTDYKMFEINPIYEILFLRALESLPRGTDKLVFGD